MYNGIDRNEVIADFMERFGNGIGAKKYLYNAINSKECKSELSVYEQTSFIRSFFYLHREISRNIGVLSWLGAEK